MHNWSLLLKPVHLPSKRELILIRGNQFRPNQLEQFTQRSNLLRFCHLRNWSVPPASLFTHMREIWFIIYHHLFLHCILSFFLLFLFILKILIIFMTIGNRECRWWTITLIRAGFSSRFLITNILFIGKFIDFKSVCPTIGFGIWNHCWGWFGLIFGFNF